MSIEFNLYFYQNLNFKHMRNKKPNRECIRIFIFLQIKIGMKDETCIKFSSIFEKSQIFYPYKNKIHKKRQNILILLLYLERTNIGIK